MSSNEERYVVFGTPTFGCTPSYEFCGAMEQVVSLLAANGIRNSHIFIPGLQFVEVARNVIVKKFLEDHTDATDLFFIDDDVGGFPAEKVVEFLSRKEDVIAGAPRMRDDFEEYPVVLHAENGAPLEHYGYYAAIRVPAGFMRIKRHVLETLASKAEIYSWPQKPGEALQILFDVFERGPVNGEFMGEDAMFCRKCAQNDFGVWVDPDIRFTHRGSKRWEGKFRDHLEMFLRGEHPTAKLKKILS